jgi:hypothetical protein
MLVELAAVDKAVWSCMDDLTEEAEPPPKTEYD